MGRFRVRESALRERTDGELVRAAQRGGQEAFGLLVTLIWLYIEILRLLMKLQSRD